MKSKKFKKFRRKIRYLFLFGLIRFLIFVSRLFPRRIWLSLFGFLGGLSYYFSAQSRKLIQKHLTMAFSREKSAGEIKALSHDVFRMMGKNVGDIFHGFRVSDMESFKKFTDIRGSEIANAAVASGKGVIFFSGHVGAFELIATELSLEGYKPLVVGTAMKDERLTNLLWSHRNKLGAYTIERGKETMRLIRTLKAGGTFGILIDQDTKAKSVFVNFFGIPCATPIGATVLAMKTGAVLIPMFFHLREDGMQEVNYYPEVELTLTGNEQEDLVVNTQKLTDIIEREIRKHPAQWVWMHERWKTKPGEVNE